MGVDHVGAVAACAQPPASPDHTPDVDRVREAGRQAPQRASEPECPVQDAVGLDPLHQLRVVPSAGQAGDVEDSDLGAGRPYGLGVLTHEDAVVYPVRSGVPVREEEDSHLDARVAHGWRARQP